MMQPDKHAESPDRHVAGGTVGAWANLAGAQWHAGRRAEACMTLTAALRRLGDEPRLHHQLGLFHAAEGRHADARRHLAAAAEADGTNADIHYHLGLAAAAEGDSLSAVEALQKAFLLRPGDLLLAWQVALCARVACRQGHRVTIRLPEPMTAPAGPDARRLAEHVAREPEFLDCFLDLPRGAADPKVWAALAGAVQAAVQRHPDRADLHLRCSRMHQQLGRMDLALLHARRAVALNGRYAQALLHFGRLEARNGRPNQALRAVRQAVAAWADWPDAHVLAAELLNRCDQKEAAARHLRRALELNPGYDRAAKELAALAA